MDKALNWQKKPRTLILKIFATVEKLQLYCRDFKYNEDFKL
jgi:hypothetical protein